MGLSIEYEWHLPRRAPERQVEASVRRLHDRAADYARRNKLGAVGEIVPLPSELGPFTFARSEPDPDAKQASRLIEAEAGWWFGVEVGEGCEPLFLGLARFPRNLITTHPRAGEAEDRFAVQFYAASRRARWKRGLRWQLEAPPGWSLTRWCKTQYASIAGWEHFHACHRHVIGLIRLGVTEGLRVTITDEGGYWPGRRVDRLRANLTEMNTAVAALTGWCKDAAGEDGAIQAPILEHPRFEQLEAEGRSRLPLD